MSRLWAIYSLTRADLLERTRRYQYVATIAVTLLIGTLLVPAKNAGYETFLIDGYRGIYNSSWIGATFAILATMMLSLFAFYNVKSAVERDRTTRVGEILAATSLARFDYALGKALSNFLVLGSMAAILFVVAVVMQFVRGESAAFNLGQIVAPFALVVVPTVAMVAAIALLFEMIPWLRGGLGNVVYFFLWSWYLVWSFQSEAKHVPWWRDMLGGNLVMRQVWAAILHVDPRAKLNSVEIGAGGESARHLFTFHGFVFSGSDVAERFVWFAVALGIVAVAAPLFDRFAKPARTAEHSKRNVVVARWQSAVARLSSPLVDALFIGGFGAIVLAELRLLVRGPELLVVRRCGGPMDIPALRGCEGAEHRRRTRLDLADARVVAARHARSRLRDRAVYLSRRSIRFAGSSSRNGSPAYCSPSRRRALRSSIGQPRGISAESKAFSRAQSSSRRSRSRAAPSRAPRGSSKSPTSCSGTSAR